MGWLLLFYLPPRKIYSLTHPDKTWYQIIFFFFLKKLLLLLVWYCLTQISQRPACLKGFRVVAIVWESTSISFPPNERAQDEGHLMSSTPLANSIVNMHEPQNRLGANSWLTRLQSTRTLNQPKVCTWLQRKRLRTWGKEVNTGRLALEANIFQLFIANTSAGAYRGQTLCWVADIYYLI